MKRIEQLRSTREIAGNVLYELAKEIIDKYCEKGWWPVYDEAELKDVRMVNQCLSLLDKLDDPRYGNLLWLKNSIPLEGDELKVIK